MYRLLIFILLVSNYFSFSQEEKKVSFRQLNVSQGLSQNSVVSIVQDSIGYMWFATQDGLNKYDGVNFKYYSKQFEDVTRPSYSKLGKTYIDRVGGLWIICNSGVLEKFEAESQSFRSVSGITDVSVIFQNKRKDYFIGTYGKGLYKIDAIKKDTVRVFENTFKDFDVYDIHESNKSIYFTTSEAIFQLNNHSISEVSVEHDPKNFSAITSTYKSDVWLGSFGNGLFHKTESSLTFSKYKHPDLPTNLNIQDLLLDTDNNLWIATYGNGLFILNTITNKVTHFGANKNDPFAIHYNDILCLFQDYTGNVWLGTDGAGLSYYDKHLTKFNCITNDQTPKDVNVDVVRAITMDENDNMWFGTSGKGLTKLHIDNNHYIAYTTNNSNLASNRIMSLYYSDNQLWIGHQGNGLQVINDSNIIQTRDEFNNQTIWKIYEHNAEQIWLCTRDNGLVLFDKTEGIVRQYTSENSVLSTNNIRTVEHGIDKNLWIGTEDQGLFKLNTETNTITKIDAIVDKIKSLYFDGKILWVGTNGNGLRVYNVLDNSVVTYTTKYLLPNNVIYGILPDAKGNLWLSSNKGITKLNPKDSQKRYVENYAIYSGLQAFEFNTGAYYKHHDGTLFFGGLEGVNWFKPNSLTVNDSKPKTVITDFKIFGKAHSIQQNAKYHHDQNTMTFAFAGLHFSQPEQNLYRYKLENHDEKWTFPSLSNQAHYTNLPPNDYTFKVLSSNYDGVWNKEPTSFRFTILKPWYLTNTMKTLYALLFLLTLYGIYKYFKFRWEVKLQLELEHAETERLKKLDEFKTKLYTNISHEFRTPLTLISGPIDQQLSKDHLNEDDKKTLGLVKQNANRLLNLVNQMLDLSLIDSGQLRLKVNEGNLNILLKQIIEAFQYKAKDKHIEIKSKIKNLKRAWFDTDVIEKITSNLLSNAIKYAPAKSDIILDANQIENAMVLSIINVNTKVSKKDFDKLFQRFYQDDSSADGVGVGLALVKELVNLSKGTIIANTVDAQKIQFTVTLPINRDAFDDLDIESTKNIENEDFPNEISMSKDQPVLLIVEDDDDIRHFVSSIFKDQYLILKAENGKLGIDLALKHIPDIIISDVMMPVQDGIELCNELKYNELTSHIPVILLTAKVGEEHEIEGLRTGADAYITKPFNSEKLQLRVQKLIENRKQLQKHFSKDFVINPEIAITSTEADFLKRLKTVFDEKITDPEFSSEAFSESMHMSRMQLHRKLKAIVGMTATEFIRSQRIKLAENLIKTSDMSISEIAYQVGFNTPSYFIKCFKEVHGVTPNEYN